MLLMVLFNSFFVQAQRNFAVANLAVVDSSNYQLHLHNDTLTIEIRHPNKWEVWLYQKNKDEKNIYYDRQYPEKYYVTRHKMSDSTLIKIPQRKIKKYIKEIITLRDSLNILKLQKYKPKCDRGIVDPLEKDGIATCFYLYSKKTKTYEYYSEAGLRLYVYYCNDRYGKNFTSLANIFYEMCKLPKVVPYELSGFGL
jgi:hypothetical protein